MSNSSTRWESAAFPTSERLGAWGEALSRVYGSWNLERAPERDFQAKMVHHASGGLQIVECICDPCAATRVRANIVSDARETVTIQIVMSGKENFTLGERQVTLGAGDVLLWNSTRPMRFEITERLRKISVTMPLSRLKCWLPERWHSIEGNLPRVSGGAHLLSSFVELVSPAYLDGSLANSDALTESLMGFLVNVLDDKDIKPQTLRASQLAAVKDYIELHLPDVTLSVTSISRAKRISIRYLHALFEAEGTSVQRFIYQQRLIRCARELQNPSMAGRTVTEIAFSWGFQNSTHFSRRFKDEFGVPPTQYRLGARGEHPEPSLSEISLARLVV